MLEKLSVTVLAEDSVPYESPLLGQHGVSFWLEAEGRGTSMRVLVDVGQNPDALLYNVGRLGISLETADAVMLTHCHYDHTQGLARVLEATGRRDLPVIAHPALFRPNFVMEPSYQDIGVMPPDMPEALAAAGGKLVLASEPLEIMPGLSTTGEVSRVTDFEEVGIALFTRDEAGQVLPDTMPDDMSLVASVEGKGLVIVTGCSHAGIVNILKQAVALTGEKRIAGVIGGLHLVEASSDRVARTVSALAEFSPPLVAAGHCTGFHAQAALYAKFKERFSTMGSGTVFRF